MGSGARAIFNGAVIAETDNFERVDGNIYFPMESLKNKDEYFEDSEHTTRCGWKGTAKYYNVVVGEKRKDNVAWYYSDTLPAANTIKNHVAFYRSVQVEEF